MIRFDHVSKLYGDKEALSDVNMTIANGEIFGLIGHNGAGKTTTISILTSIIEASYGEVYVDELPLSEHRDDIKKRIGYVPDSPDIFLNLTAIEYWHFLAKFMTLMISSLMNGLNDCHICLILRRISMI
mgnify:CR=1 FL=1